MKTPITPDVAIRFYIDCEFDGHDGPLLSIALVREDGRSIHIGTKAEARDPWVVANVVPIMGRHQATLNWRVEVNDVGTVLREFIGDCERPVIVADSPVDIGRFCSAITTSPNGGWASAEYPQMTFEVHNVDCYPTDLPGAVQHNAWWDAMALRHRLTSLSTPPARVAIERARSALERLANTRMDLSLTEWGEISGDILSALSSTTWQGIEGEVLQALCQYRDDLRWPPAPDSVERRLGMINALIAKTKGDA